MHGHRAADARWKPRNLDKFWHAARIVAVALGGVNAACTAVRTGPATDPVPWTEYLGDARRASSANERLARELAPTWRAGIQKPASGPPAIGGGVVAVLSVNRYLSLFERSTGERLWRVRLNAVGAGGPLLTGDRVLAATGGRDGRVYAVRLENGSRLWRRGVGRVSPPIASAGNRIIAVTERGRVVGLDAETGEEVWDRVVRGPVRSGVTVVSDLAFVATDDSLFLLSTADGEIVHRGAAPGALLAPPAVSGDTLVLASPDGFVTTLSAADLAPIWRVDLGEPAFASPSVARGMAVVATLNGKLWRIPLADPESRTMVDLGVPVRAAPAPVADGVLVGTIQGEVLFSPPDGTVVRRVRVDGPIEQQPMVRSGVLFVVDGVGGVHAWQ